MIRTHLAPPSARGTEAQLRSLVLAERVTLRTTAHDFVFRYRSPAHFVEAFRTRHGPVHKAFAALGPDAGVALERDLLDLLARNNRGSTGSRVVPPST